MKIINSVNMNKKDIFNASASSKKAEKGKKLNIVGACMAVVEESDEEKEVSYLVADNGDVYGLTSSVVYKSMDSFLDYLTDAVADGEKFVTITFGSGKAKSGREFTTINLV